MNEALWNSAMLIADVGVLLIAGFLLAGRSPRLLAVCLYMSVPAVAGAVHFLAPEIVRYRGSSGIATALVVAYALELARTPGASRCAAIAALVLGAAKLAWEITTGVSPSSSMLPPGVRVAPVVHVAGVGSGLAACLATIGPCDPGAR